MLVLLVVDSSLVLFIVLIFAHFSHLMVSRVSDVICSFESIYLSHIG